MENCTVEKCPVKLEPATAWVPSLQAIRKVIGKVVESVELKKHIFCGRHARALREEGLRMYSYTSTLQELERRQGEREAERDAVGRYSTMYLALKDAGVKPPKKRRKAKAKTATIVEQALAIDIPS